MMGVRDMTLVVKKKETIIVDPEGIVIGAIMVIETMEVIKTVEVAEVQGEVREVQTVMGAE